MHNLKHNGLKAAKVALWAMVLMLPLFLSSQVAQASTFNAVKGLYYRANGNQYKNSCLQLKDLGNNCSIFEFTVVDGNEREEFSKKFVISGIFVVDNKGQGLWVSKDKKCSLTFTINGDKVTVKQNGTLPLSVAGVYTFLEYYFEVSGPCAVELVKHLPTAQTSLNSNNGPYTLSCAPGLVDDYFYEVTGLFKDTKEVLAKFYVALDLSCVYRVDTEKPILIYGQTDYMMQFQVLRNSSESMEKTGKNTTSISEPYEEAVVSASINSSSQAVGSTKTIAIKTPGNIPYKASFTSGNPKVASVSDKGLVKILAPGKTKITCRITIGGNCKVVELIVGSTQK